MRGPIRNGRPQPSITDDKEILGRPRESLKRPGTSPIAPLDTPAKALARERTSEARSRPAAVGHQLVPAVSRWQNRPHSGTFASPLTRHRVPFWILSLSAVMFGGARRRIARPQVEAADSSTKPIPMR